MAERSLLHFSQYVCARMTVMCEIMDQRHDWSYAGRVITELSGTLEQLAFTEDEGAFIHRALDPLAAKYRTEYWFTPVAVALQVIPGAPVLVMN